jgi:probable addiction module antidote protein
MAKVAPRAGAWIEMHRLSSVLQRFGDIARSKGMAQIARELNLDRASLYKSLSTAGNPSFFTILKVLDNLGFRLKVEQKESA